MNALFWRALLAFLLLPGTIGFVVPLWLIAPGGIPTNAWGDALLVPGSLLLLWCVSIFYRSGRGTLAPWSPPETLVDVGPYRVSRNPMYIAVSLILWGWAVAYRSTPLAIYAGCVMVAFHVRVILNEEPFLKRTHGAAFDAYARRVPRWLGAVRRRA